ncbi:MAG: hypothetical protein Q8P00_05645, partial [Dehalococcoidia bacterium]|nr:hypothetical protein [Dehalococcoidia bacterium]
MFQIVDSDEDHLAPKFHPDGFPITGHKARWFKRLAKLTVNNRRLYPFFKLTQMALQDSTARKLGRRYAADIIVSDGNTLLSAMGRAVNYSNPEGGAGDVNTGGLDSADLKVIFEYLLDGKPVPRESEGKLCWLGKAKTVQRMARILGLDAAWLPDVVVFLDLSPEVAMERIASRGKRIDRHENRDDLAQVRSMYLKTVEAFAQYRSPKAAYIRGVDKTTPGETLQAIVDMLGPRVSSRQSNERPKKIPLGTTDVKLTGSAIWGKLLSYRYLVKYLIINWFRGTWREPTFLFSGLGRLFRREGYSAGTMRAIYDRDSKRYGLGDRIFLEYPLHRAVYDRLHILTRNIEPELEKRLQTGREVRIFTAPCGFAYDLFLPLEAIASRTPQAMKQVRLMAADLDPHGHIGEEVTERARRLGIRFEFLRGDIMEAAMHSKLEQAAPYDIVLFVGLSGWLPKPQTILHLKWAHRNVREDGIFVSDCFTPEFYALSGRYVGYKANYYAPDVYRALLDYCGFDGLGAH